MAWRKKEKYTYITDDIWDTLITENGVPIVTEDSLSPSWRLKEV